MHLGLAGPNLTEASKNKQVVDRLLMSMYYRLEGASPSGCFELSPALTGELNPTAFLAEELTACANTEMRKII